MAAKTNVLLVDHDASNRFPMESGSFDCVTSCYSIYYVRDIRDTLSEFRRLLKTGSGRAFIVGPSSDNSKELYDLHREISGRDLPEDFRHKLQRMNDEVVPVALELFSHVQISPWVNRVHFRGEEGVRRATDYYRSSLLFEEETADPAAREHLLAEFGRRVAAEIEKNGVYYMIKRALGLTLSGARI